MVAVRLELKVLSEYDAKEAKVHTAQGGGVSSIIGLLEVVESDFSKDLAEIGTTEEAATASLSRMPSVATDKPVRRGVRTYRPSRSTASALYMPHVYQIVLQPFGF